jgi:VHL beta domain
MCPLPTEPRRSRRVPTNAIVAIAATIVALVTVAWVVTPQAGGEPAAAVAATSEPAPEQVPVPVEPAPGDLLAGEPAPGDPLPGEPAAAAPAPTAPESTDAEPTVAVSTPPADVPPSTAVPTPGTVPGGQPVGTGVRYLSPAAERDQRSMNNSTPTSIRFVNRRADRARLTVYWLDYAGARVGYGDVAPGAELVIRTFLTHPWVVTTPDGAALFVVLPGVSPGTVTVS